MNKTRPLTPPRPATVRLSQATEEQILAAVAAVADALVDVQGTATRWLSRAEATRDGTFPDAVALIVLDGRPVGWAGWVPYPDAERVWQSTTYFSPDQRGTGLLGWARCWQIHAMATAEEWASGRGGVAAFVSSIADWNHRSQSASRRYAAEHRWPQAWESRYEPVEGRHAFVLTWPTNAPHSCVRPR